MNVSEIQKAVKLPVEAVYDFGDSFLVCARKSKDEFDPWKIVDKKTYKVRWLDMRKEGKRFMETMRTKPLYGSFKPGK